MRVNITYLDEIFKITYGSTLLYACNNLSSKKDTIKYAEELAEYAEKNLDTILQSMNQKQDDKITKDDITRIQSTVDYLAMMAE